LQTNFDRLQGKAVFFIFSFSFNFSFIAISTKRFSSVSRKKRSSSKIEKLWNLFSLSKLRSDTDSRELAGSNLGLSTKKLSLGIIGWVYFIIIQSLEVWRFVELSPSQLRKYYFND